MTIKLIHDPSSKFASELYSMKEELVHPSTLEIHNPSSILAKGL